MLVSSLHLHKVYVFISVCLFACLLVCQKNYSKIVDDFLFSITKEWELKTKTTGYRFGCICVLGVVRSRIECLYDIAKSSVAETCIIICDTRSYYVATMNAIMHAIQQEMCAAESDKFQLVRKAAAIIACYLHSRIPPSIHVSVDEQLVQAVLQQQQHASPNLFRDAQVK